MIQSMSRRLFMSWVQTPAGQRNFAFYGPTQHGAVCRLFRPSIASQPARFGLKNNHLFEQWWISPGAVEASLRFGRRLQLSWLTYLLTCLWYVEMMVRQFSLQHEANQKIIEKELLKENNGSRRLAIAIGLMMVAVHSFPCTTVH